MARKKLQYVVQIYDTLLHGEDVIVVPNEDSAMIWWNDEGSGRWEPYTAFVSRFGIDGIQLIGYHYRGATIRVNDPGYSSLIERIDQSYEFAEQVYEIEVVKVEPVINWVLTFKVAITSAVGLNALIWVNILLQRVVAG